MQTAGNTEGTSEFYEQTSGIIHHTASGVVANFNSPDNITARCLEKDVEIYRSPSALLC